MSFPVRRAADAAPEDEGVGPQKPSWPALDGLRALAVAAVVAFHATASVARNGYVGVDVFFVLSGFLITRLLLDEHHRVGRIDLRSFYVRRALRLLPALVAVCAIVLVIGMVTGRQTAAIAKAVAAALFYVANFWLYSGHDMPLLEHTWTLSLEEQFYLLWPAMLVVLLMVRRSLATVLVAGSICGLTLLLALPVSGPIAGVQDNYLRATGLLAGCAIGWVSSVRRLPVARSVGRAAVLGLAVLLFLPWRLPEFIFTSGYSPAVILAIPAVVWLTSPLAAGGLMAAPPARWLGRRSYGLYLWHFPVLSLAVHQVPSGVPLPARVAGGVVIALVVTALSYRYLEEPFLRRKARFQPDAEQRGGT